MMWNLQDSSFTGTNLNAKMLVSFAFGIREDLISGLPSWAGSVRYDINAKIIDPDLPTLKRLTDKQRNDMLTQLLADRFALKSHTESKQLPVYNLVIAPHGPKFKPSPTQDETKGNWRNNNTEFTGTVISIGSLVDFLASHLQRTVIDQTNLTAPLRPPPHLGPRPPRHHRRPGQRPDRRHRPVPLLRHPGPARPKTHPRQRPRPHPRHRPHRATVPQLAAGPPTFPKSVPACTVWCDTPEAPPCTKTIPCLSAA